MHEMTPSPEVIATLAVQLLVLAYGVGVFKTKVAGMQTDIDKLKGDIGQLKKLVVLWMLGPDVDSDLFADDVETMREVVKRRRHATSGD